MDRTSRIRGGSVLWDDQSPASTVINNDFFGQSVSGNTLWLKVAGVWKACTTWIKVAGVWKTCIPHRLTGATEVALTFGSLVNWQESPAGWWGPIATGDNGSGKCTKSLPANTDGYIVSDITNNAGTINNFNTGIGFALSNSLTPPYSYDWLVYVEGSTGNYKTYDPGTGYVDSGMPAASGHRLKTERVGDTWFARYWNGTSWVLIREFPNKSTAQAYIYGGNADIGQFEYVVNPKGFNVV